MTNVLILFAHPKLEKSRVQSRLLHAARQVPGVRIHDLYEQYPDFHINIPFEQGLLLEHELILLQHPFYWYSCPPLMKQWIDLVLQHGWAYGKDGAALSGKKIMNVISAGGIREAYSHEGFNRYTIADFLAPINQTARLCKMDYLPPFVVHGTHRATEPELDKAALQYGKLLEMLVAGTLPQELQEIHYLNDLIPIP
jgi:glutathione-regulated potassium-efflux system ancillary protein KefG